MFRSKENDFDRTPYIYIYFHPLFSLFFALFSTLLHFPFISFLLLSSLSLSLFLSLHSLSHRQTNPRELQFPRDLSSSRHWVCRHRNRDDRKRPCRFTLSLQHALVGAHNRGIMTFEFWNTCRMTSAWLEQIYFSREDCATSDAPMSEIVRSTSVVYT